MYIPLINLARRIDQLQTTLYYSNTSNTRSYTVKLQPRVQVFNLICPLDMISDTWFPGQCPAALHLVVNPSELPILYTTQVNVYNILPFMSGKILYKFYSAVCFFALLVRPAELILYCRTYRSRERVIPTISKQC